MTRPVERLCIVGVGLIGGSLARALRAAGAVGEVVGAGRDPMHLRRAVELGVIDRFETDIGRAAREADAVVAAVPLGAMRPVFAALRGQLRPDALLTDVGSAKGSVVAAARAAFGTLPPGFVPGHPIAGTEKSGVEASFPELFRGRRVILTPLPESAPAAVARATALWQAAGAIVESMAVEHHDEVLAATSHLPHMLAYTLVDTLARMPDGEEIFRYAAGGFRDFTRIASSDPTMWRDICQGNQPALLAVIRRFEGVLGELAASIERGDGAEVFGLFERAKAARDRFADLGNRNESPE